jgi:glutamine amidotransferase
MFYSHYLRQFVRCQLRVAAIEDALQRRSHVTIAIVAAGLGNVKSVKRMIDYIGGEADLVETPARLKDYSHIILPGVGAFDHGMELLGQQGWDAEICKAATERGQIVMGICLGMQLLCRGSEEGEKPGLGLIGGDVKRLESQDGSRIKIPHIGWSVTTPTQSSPLFDISNEELRYYFVHGYSAHCDDESDVYATADYGGPIVASIGRDNVMGAQFHPEKSHRFGMALLTKFMKLA